MNKLLINYKNLKGNEIEYVVYIATVTFLSLVFLSSFSTKIFWFTTCVVVAISFKPHIFQKKD